MNKIQTAFHTNYIPVDDITIIWQDMYLVEDGKVVDHVQRHLAGWHYGKPDPTDDKFYSNMPLTAQFCVTEMPVEDASKPKFQVLDYEYLNTGGNTMVGIFTVWLPSNNQTVYIIANEEGFNITTVDYIRNDLGVVDYDALILDAVNWDYVYGIEEYFDLYRHCFTEYTKSDCRYFGCSRAVPYVLLSDELKTIVSADYLAWCDEHTGGKVRIDCKGIIEDEEYTRACDEKLQAVKDWKKWHDDLMKSPDEEIEMLYDKCYRITFNGKRVYLPFNADTFNRINDVLTAAIDNW